MNAGQLTVAKRNKKHAWMQENVPGRNSRDVAVNKGKRRRDVCGTKKYPRNVRVIFFVSHYHDPREKSSEGASHLS